MRNIILSLKHAWIKTPPQPDAPAALFDIVKINLFLQRLTWIGSIILAAAVLGLLWALRFKNSEIYLLEAGGTARRLEEGEAISLELEPFAREAIARLYEYEPSSAESRWRYCDQWAAFSLCQRLKAEPVDSEGYRQFVERSFSAKEIAPGKFEIETEGIMLKGSLIGTLTEEKETKVILTVRKNKRSRHNSNGLLVEDLR